MSGSLGATGVQEQQEQWEQLELREQQELQEQLELRGLQEQRELREQWQLREVLVLLVSGVHSVNEGIPLRMNTLPPSF